MIKKIAIASDHAALELKQDLVQFLKEESIEVVDLGPFDDQSVDYPDYGIKLAECVARGEVDRGIAMCGTGIGMSIVVNRFPGIRGTLCHEPYAARMCREHNDSNVLILAGRMIGKGLARDIVRTWLDTPFEGGRHQRRLDKIENIHSQFAKGEN